MEKARPPLTGIVLCGGRARRMDSADKPLVHASGKPLVAHVIERLRPQVDRLSISCGTSSAAAYEQFGAPLVHDRFEDAGPLAGVEAGLAASSTEWCLVCPGDAPVFPADLGLRLWQARGEAEVVYMCEHYLFMLASTARAPGLARWLESGGRKVQAWLVEVGAVEVPLELEDRFLNINTAQQLAAFERESNG